MTAIIAGLDAVSALLLLVVLFNRGTNKGGAVACLMFAALYTLSAVVILGGPR